MTQDEIAKLIPSDVELAAIAEMAAGGTALEVLAAGLAAWGGMEIETSWTYQRLVLPVEEPTP